MKLAEALLLRSDCQKRLEQLKLRLKRSVKVQEGDTPPENPEDLFQETARLTEHIQSLIQRINRTNSGTPFSEGRTLSDILAERDVLVMRRKVYTDVIEAAAVSQSRYSRSEIKYVSMVNAKDMQARVDTLAKAYRELDTRIQEINWSTELME